MGILDITKKAVNSLLGRKPALIPREQIPAYLKLCNEVISQLSGKGTLYPLEMDFILAVSEHCENCVLHWSSLAREDSDTIYGSDRLVKKFWSQWDKSFSEVAEKRRIKEGVAIAWQQQLYTLRLFAAIEHFRGVVDQFGAPPIDPSTVYQREAQHFDLRAVLEEVIEQEGIKGVSLPAPAKAA